ncbi:MAG: hypothetical protein HFF01_08895 [Erysipelotrichaceae bacterium]|nr:hypothetical protein [Erysipelotrichaceae bacterium]MCI9525126.1 hypothetical protein [Erysipelotrichaceae bacterium]
MNLNKCLLISFILSLLYSIYIITYFTGEIGTTNGAQQAGAAIATALVLPHMICMILGTIFNGLGCFLHKSSFALTGAILYAVAMVLFPPYLFFVIMQMILSFVGYAGLRKANQA